MNGRNGENGEDGDESKSFADLIGETKSLAHGPARAAETKRTIPTPRPRSDQTRSGSFRFPDPDECLLGAAEGVGHGQLLALKRGEPEPEENIDLHGLRRDAAARLVVSRLESARARHLRCVRVIHGRGQRSETGETVLRDALPAWLSEPPGGRHVLAFAPAPDQFGGPGATLVLLRRPD